MKPNAMNVADNVTGFITVTEHVDNFKNKYLVVLYKDFYYNKIDYK